MATTETYLVGDGEGLPGVRLGKGFCLKQTINTATTGVTSGDIVKLWIIPPDTFIEKCIVNVTDAEGGTLTVDIGDYLVSSDAAVDADGWGVGVNGNSAVASIDTDSAHHATFGKLYTVASWIGVLFNNTADHAVIDVIITGFDCR